MDNFEVIDNFLNRDDFEMVKSSIDHTGFPWFYENEISKPNLKSTNFKFYLTHTCYIDSKPNSKLWDEIGQLFFDKLKMKSILRMKVNFYPNQGTFEEHDPHIDYPYHHKGAIFSLNTCNGYTKLYDGTKIDSVENRMLLFNSSLEHSSTNTTNAVRRLNINFNYF